MTGHQGQAQDHATAFIQVILNLINEIFYKALQSFFFSLQGKSTQSEITPFINALSWFTLKLNNDEFTMANHHRKITQKDLQLFF